MCVCVPVPEEGHVCISAYAEACVMQENAYARKHVCMYVCMCV